MGLLKILAAIVVLVAGGHYLEMSARSSPIRELLRRPSVESREMGSGKMRSVLRRMDVLRVPSSSRRPERLGKSTQRIQYRVRPYGFSDRILKSADFDDEILAWRRRFSNPLPTISIAVRDDDLYGPDYGILAKSNRLERGRSWERRAQITYFDGDRAVFATTAGIRLHGGNSRIRSLKTGNPSMRLHLRDSYGLVETPPGLFFDGTSPPLRAFILHNDRRFGSDHFLNPLAYDIAGRIGCIVPKVQPVEVFINGSRIENLYFLTEYLSTDYVQRRLGHDECRLTECKVRGRSRQARRPKFYSKALRWAINAPAPLTVETVKTKYDIDNLISWIITVSFCATTDPHQGLNVLDERTGKMLLMAWDMDHSFQIRHQIYTGREWRRYYSAMRRQEHYKDRTFEIVSDSRHLHSVLYDRLLSEDPAFRRLLAEKALFSFNHLVTPTFINDRLDHYREIARRFGLNDSSCLDRYARFLRRRPEYYRSEMEWLLKLDSIRSCTVDVPEGVSIIVDGVPHHEPYHGYYLTGSKITVRLADHRPSLDRVWCVNGQRRNASHEEMAVDVADDLKIELAAVSDL